MNFTTYHLEVLNHLGSLASLTQVFEGIKLFVGFCFEEAPALLGPAPTLYSSSTSSVLLSVFLVFEIANEAPEADVKDEYSSDLKYGPQNFVSLLNPT